MLFRIRTVTWLVTAMLVGLAWLVPPSQVATAATLYWSANGTTQGGTGTWDTSAANWGTAASGPFGQAWNNATNDLAIFGGSPASYTVTLGSNVTVGGMTSNVNATIAPGAGPSSITLGASGTFTVASGRTLSISAALSQGANALTLSGAGTEILVSGAVTGTGNTTINLSGGGVYRAATLATGNLNISQGMYGLSSNFSRTLGTGAGQIQFGGSNLERGFSAFGSDLTISGLSGSALNWSATNFIGAGSTLVLGHSNSTVTTIWDQAMSLAGSPRTVKVNDGSAEVDARLQSSVSGGSSGATNILRKTGAGTLDLNATNSYWGTTQVVEGTLVVGSGTTTGTLSTNDGSAQVSAGATLAVNRSGTLTQGSGTGATRAIGGIVSGEGNFQQRSPGGAVFNLALANTYSGTTSVTSGILGLTNSLAIQNSFIDTQASVAGTGTAGFQTNQTSLTIGGLAGNKDLASVFTTTSGGYSGVTALTLNPGSGASHNYSGVISNGAAGMTLTKTGAGTQTLSGVNTYTGATAVDAGVLALDGSLDAASAVTVAQGATLAGIGTAAGAVTINGTLRPGNAGIGVITLGSLVLGSTGTTAFDITAAGTRGTAYDGVTISSTAGLTYGGSLTLAFGTSLIADGTIFDLVDFTGSTSGNLDSVTSTGFYAGAWTSDGNGSFSLTKDQQVLTFSQGTGDLSIAAIVPEPGVLGLAAVVAGAGLVAWARRRAAPRR